MNAIELIGKVAAEFLRNSVPVSDSYNGVARFLLDRLTGEQVTQICIDLLNDQELKSNVEMKIPKTLVTDPTLPEHTLTNEPTTHWRHANCNKPILILANSEDDQGQSLRDINRIGAQELKTKFEIWVEIAAKDLPLTEEHKKHWVKALKGLQQASDYSLDRFSQYIVQIRSRIMDEGDPLIDAMGWALTAIRLPRDSKYFSAIAESKLGHVAQWRKKYEQVINKRGCLLHKQTSARQIIDDSQLQNAFEKVKEEINEKAHSTIEAFIATQPGWTEESASLSEFEWETDNISALFSGLRLKQTRNLAEETLEFFEDEYPDSLSNEKFAYLDALVRKKSYRDPSDDDKEFYEEHRYELAQKKTLKAKWDRFIYGKPIECNDFFIGLLQAVERLFEQLGSINGDKSLLIKTQKQKKKSDWLDLNADVGLYFCTRYKGLTKLTSEKIKWETHWLFKFDEFLEKEKKKPDYRRNSRTAKAATQIRFYLELTCGEDSSGVQLIWQGDPNQIGFELHNDLSRLVEAPFPRLEVGRNPVSKKGKFQGISLKDVNTFDAGFRKDKGSLVGPHDKNKDIEKTFYDNLENALDDKRISDSDYGSIITHWQNFRNSYAKAISDWLGEAGISSSSFFEQCYFYNELLNSLLALATGDINRVKLWQLIIEIGNTQIGGGLANSIVTPWHPMRMMAIAVKANQLVSLINNIIELDRVDFGDPKLFFSELITELEHSYYPEVSIGYLGNQPSLLVTSDTVNDYSLMESPTNAFYDSETNEDPLEASKKVLSLVKRYIELQPHEQANLSVALYNCDSTGLPVQLVKSLSTLNDKDEEVRCQIVLRHSNKKKLSGLYEQMVESTQNEPDTFIASEVAQNFMAKLRIEVMANSAPISNHQDGKPTDIVFLQDVISRNSKLIWVPAVEGEMPDILDHVPPRWSRKRLAQKDELKSTVYLVCPRQPAVGMSYLKIVKCIVNDEQPTTDFFLPARQISFQNQQASAIFDEVHRLGEWVINYDELLDRRQLLKQGVRVIRYKQSRTQGRNLIVSSNSPLSLLKALVIRRLNDLNLNIAEIDKFAEDLIDDANKLSGDIVLRAAKCGVFASELIGVVLSKALLRSEIGNARAIGWYFLDDYAKWLGQSEQQIADIMVLALKEDEEGNPYLQVILSEVKFVKSSVLSDAKKSSQKQLRDTIARINNAIFGAPERMDRDLWLARLSDLIIDADEFMFEGYDIEHLRDSLRNGSMPIDLRGYSHVFVSDNDEENSITSEQINLPKVERCYQEVFNRNDLRQLLTGYWQKTDLISIRKRIGDNKPWEEFYFSLPADAKGTVRKFEKVPSEPEKKRPYKEEIRVNGKVNSKDEKQTESPVKEPENKYQTEPEIPWCRPALNSWINQSTMSKEVTTEEQEWAEEITKKLRSALISYDLQAKVLNYRLTPNAIIIRLKGSDRLKVQDIEKKQSQLLTTHALNIINASALPGEVVVSIARPQRQLISLADVWKIRNVNQTLDGLNLSLIVGVKEIDGELLYLNVGQSFEGLEQHAPHTLIAGSTGSGKSVLMQNLLLDICATCSDDLAHIYLIDPKGVDYLHFEDLPHLKEGIITGQDKAIEVLQYLTDEMDRRFACFKDQKATNLVDFNTKVSTEERLPVLWLFHDEFADWMLTDNYRNAVSAAVQRLGVKARAAGIHLIFAAQRPDNHVLPMQLRDNLGNRLILRLESVGTSEIALGQKGAEKLLGKGHLAARLSGEPNIIYAQVPFLSGDALIAATEAIKK